MSPKTRFFPNKFVFIFWPIFKKKKKYLRKGKENILSKKVKENLLTARVKKLFVKISFTFESKKFSFTFFRQKVLDVKMQMSKCKKSWTGTQAEKRLVGLGQAGQQKN